MPNFFEDNPDLHYYLGAGVDWNALAAVTEAGFRHTDGFSNGADALTFYREVASTAGAFAAQEVAPHAAEIDRQGVWFKDGEASFPPRLSAIFARMAQLDLFGLTLPRELGGSNAPLLLYYINGELLARADVSVMAHYGFHGGIAMAMLVLSLLEGTTEVDRQSGRIARTRWAEEMAEIATGRAWGSMDITEPDAGSDMAALRTVATQDASGAWSVTGHKIFITSGHGKYHFVIARTAGAGTNGSNGHGRNGHGQATDEGNDGLRQLSMFLVRAYHDELDGRRTRLASVDRIEEKLGHHGSATAALTFDGTPAELVGKQGEGFGLMLEIMNNARLSVGFESIGLCEAAFRLARSYAAERRSMGKTIDRHEIIADYLDEMEIDIIGLRALAMHAAFHEEMAHKVKFFGGLLNGHATSGDQTKNAREHRVKSRRATPLLKYLAAEKAVEMARRCLQIHGGNGYMREFGAEKLLRDAMVLPIYEGTSQIQALMATKDTLTAILKDPQAFVRRSAQTRWLSISARDGLQRRVARLERLSLAIQQHVMRLLFIAKLKATRGKPLASRGAELFKRWNPRQDFSFALLHAERLTRVLADVAIARVLLAQCGRHQERRTLLERYLRRAEPRVRFLHDEITSASAKVLGRIPTDGAVAAAEG